MVDLLKYFSFQPVFHDWCNKGCGMCYPVWDGAYKITLTYTRRHITINKMLSASLRTRFHSLKRALVLLGGLGLILV